MPSAYSTKCLAKRDYIAKEKGKFVVRSHAGQKLGEHRTRAEALQQLRAVEYHKAHDAALKSVSNIESPLQPHELPERRSNPHHAHDPLREHSANGDPTGVENRYLKTPDDGGAPAVDEAGVMKGGTEIPAVQEARENLATERAEERAALHELGVPQEERKLPFEPGGNGDPSPNPSKEQTIGSTASVTIAGGANVAQPDESMDAKDEGDP